MLSLTLNEVQWAQFEVQPFQRAIFGPVETMDGYVMIAIASEKTFQGLMRRIGHPAWVTDPRFEGYVDRSENWADLMAGVETWSRQGDDGRMSRGLAREGVPGRGLPYRGGRPGRSPDCPSRGARPGRGRRGHVQGDQPAVSDVGCGRMPPGQQNGDARRAHRNCATRLLGRNRPCREIDWARELTIPVPRNCGRRFGIPPAPPDGLAVGCEFQPM